jgi:hypothetical protein
MKDTMPKLPGFYVRGRYYGMRHAQAVARARWLADEHITLVEVIEVRASGETERFRTVYPGESKREAA